MKAERHGCQVPLAHGDVTTTAGGGAVFTWDDGRQDTGDAYAGRFAPSGGRRIAAHGTARLPIGA